VKIRTAQPTRSLKDLMDLQGRASLVTGGGGHIGGVICDALAELGSAVAVLDLDEAACTRQAARIRDSFRQEALSLVTDLSDEAAVREVPEAVVKHFGRLDVLVNCAALVGGSQLEGWVVPFEEQRTDTWRRAIEVNLTAPFLLAQASATALKASGHGSIINIGSIYGLVGPDLRLYTGTSLGNPAAYAASKGGLIQASRWLATVLAPTVRVNTICCGGVARHQPEEFVSRYVDRTPLQRMATEEDFKGAVAYLASDLSAYVTGHNLVVDGGWTAW
jgi:NAD(P)-dependent dehydrogenase (short-subunit alcohol dehydrogenase family)